MRIAFCQPELAPLQLAINGGPADAAYIQQGYIAAGLLARHHHLSYIAPYQLSKLVCTTNLQQPCLAPQTWSASRWFELAAKIAWRAQRWLGIPYLNVFSNYCRLDACLQCLPGHDIAYERNGIYNAAVALACRRLKLPYVLFFDADQLAELDFMGQALTGLLRWRANRLLRFNLRAADQIICVSDAAKKHLVAHRRVPPHKVAVFPNGVDTRRFRPDPEARREVRAAMDIDARPLIIFTGSFYQWHDVATLVDAFARLLAHYPDARLLLVGDGAERPAITRRVAEANLSHAVRFTGAVAHAQVPRLVAAADIAVAPYPPMQQELWLSPMKLFEYMAAGVAIIASAAGQVATVIQDGDNGLLVPPGDVAAMASALRQLVADAALRGRLGRQARADAERHYSWEQYLSRLERLFSAVTDRHPRKYQPAAQWVTPYEQ